MASGRWWASLFFVLIANCEFVFCCKTPHPDANTRPVGSAPRQTARANSFIPPSMPIGMKITGLGTPPCDVYTIQRMYVFIRGRVEISSRRRQRHHFLAPMLPNSPCASPGNIPLVRPTAPQSFRVWGNTEPHRLDAQDRIAPVSAESMGCMCMSISLPTRCRTRTSRLLSPIHTTDTTRD